MQVRVLLLIEVFLSQMDESANLRVILDISNSNLVTTEKPLVLELLVQTRQKFSEKLIAFSGELLRSRGFLSKGFRINDHLD